MPKVFWTSSNLFRVRLGLCVYPHDWASTFIDTRTFYFSSPFEFMIIEAICKPMCATDLAFPFSVLCLHCCYLWIHLTWLFKWKQLSQEVHVYNVHAQYSTAFFVLLYLLFEVWLKQTVAEWERKKKNLIMLFIYLRMSHLIDKIRHD